jgi:hypothetical protein
MNFSLTTKRGLSRAERSDQIQTQINANEIHQCAVEGCAILRNGVGRFCLKHKRRQHQVGHASHRVPSKSEIQSSERIVRNWLAQMTPEEHDMHGRLTEQWVRSMQKPPNLALPPGRVQRNFSHQQKADIVLAWATKIDVDLEGLLIRSAALQLWGRLHYRGRARERDRFLWTQAGRWLSYRSAIVQRRTRIQYRAVEIRSPYGKYEGSQRLPVEYVDVQRWETVGPVKAQIGKRAADGISYVLGSDWIDLALAQVRLTDYLSPMPRNGRLSQSGKCGEKPCGLCPVADQ